jgi:formylglycine-generating enzyme required for sulfatase activity
MKTPPHTPACDAWSTSQIIAIAFLLGITLLSATLWARPVRIASLRFELTDTKKSVQEATQERDVGYLSQVPAISLKRASGRRIKMLSPSEIAATLPADLDLSDCGARCPQEIGRAISADWVTHGSLFILSQNRGVRLQLHLTNTLNGVSLIDEMITAQSVEALETTLIKRGPKWIEELEHQIVTAAQSPLRLPAQSPAAETQKARWSALGIEWVPLKAGQFKMGTLKGDPTERPPHGVQVASFNMMKTEVTARQYWRCVQAKACSPISEREGCVILSPNETTALNCVTWAQASAFARWIGARLPTEIEWEFAARGEAGRRFPWGEDRASCAHLNYKDERGQEGCGRAGPRAPCEHPLGISVEGICDLSGNVWEWVEDDWHRDYINAPVQGAWCDGDCATSSSRTYKVYRGGSWYHDWRQARGSSRSAALAKTQSVGVGFRCAL